MMGRTTPTMLTFWVMVLLAMLLGMTSCKKESPEPNPTKTIAKTDQIVLQFELPEPMFDGTPPDLRDIENLEIKSKGKRSSFLVPLGTENIALGKPVTSTDNEPIIGEIEMITDDDKEAMDGSYVELGPLKQSVTVDLGDTFNVNAIVLWHYHKQARIYFDVIVQISEDPDFINTTTLFNNDIDNSLGLGIGLDKLYVESNKGKLIDAKGDVARYVRLYSNGNSSNDMNHYIEVAVYGKPAS